MEDSKRSAISVETIVNAPVEKAWESWTNPEHCMQWCHASDDWHAPYADNDLQVGGKFKTTMAAKDGSVSFDFEGVYTDVDHHKLLKYEMADGRKVSVEFYDQGDTTKVVEIFDPESQNPIEMQRGGWQAILDNYKKYTELGS
ncbi:SRPBCC family protein [Daejeonella sp.]|uniref:SRPBCC family protein n=1 Tax=Daejeonella sp. TaxID=2805397 RepID=UPI0030BC875D